jgi:pimeloyl-ACP methyl ester carboxylesterase
VSKIILVPGLLCDQTVWQPLLDRLDGGAFVAMAPEQDTLTGMAQEILASHDGQLIVLGHSMGARIAMEMVRLKPERITRLGLFDTGIHPLKEGETAKRAEIVKFAFDNGMKALADRWLPGMIHPMHQQNPLLMQSLEDMVLRMNPDLHARQINALVNRPDAREYLKEITCPVLLLVGRQDQWSPISQHQAMLEHLPNAYLEIVDDAGHFSLVEQPETASKVIVNFLSQ